MAEAKDVTIGEFNRRRAMILNDIENNGAEYVIWSGGGRRHKVYPIARVIPYKEESGLPNPDAVNPEH